MIEFVDSCADFSDCYCYGDGDENDDDNHGIMLMMILMVMLTMVLMMMLMMIPSTGRRFVRSASRRRTKMFTKHIHSGQSSPPIFEVRT